MADTFFLTRDDLLPTLRATLKDPPTSLAPLTGATVKLVLKPRPPLTGVAVEKTMTIIDATLKIVDYAWVAGDTAVAGEFDVVVRVTYPDTKVVSYPNADPLARLVVREKLT
jgi:hypothetical protein